jgi:hypothetical protein
MLCASPRVKFGANGAPFLFGCRRCEDCRMRLRMQKISAIELEAKEHLYGGDTPVGVLLLLSYSSDNLPTVLRDTRVYRDVPCVGGPGEPEVRKVVVRGSLGPDAIATLDRRDFQLFMKRLRQRCFPVEDRKMAGAADLRSRLGIVAERVRFAMCGEYGTGNERPHYHVLIFGFPSCKSAAFAGDFSCQCEIHRFYRSCWQLGRVSCDGTYQGARSGGYICQYMTKSTINTDLLLQGRVPEFYEASRCPPLGDRAVHVEASVILDFEDQSSGEKVVDFPSRVEVDGRKHCLTRRQVKLGRRAIGRSDETPEAVVEARSARYADLWTEAQVAPLGFRKERFRELVLEKHAAARAEADRRRADRLEVARTRNAEKVARRRPR